MRRLFTLACSVAACAIGGFASNGRACWQQPEKADTAAERPTRGTFTPQHFDRSMFDRSMFDRPSFDPPAPTSPHARRDLLPTAKVALPATPIYRGGMTRPNYRGGLMGKNYPAGFPRIMPYGFASIPWDAIGHTKADVGLITDPKRFLTDADPEPTYSVMKLPRGFEPEAVLDMARRDDRAALQHVGAQYIENGRRAANRAGSYSPDRWRRFLEPDVRKQGASGVWDRNLHTNSVLYQDVQDEAASLRLLVGSMPADAIKRLAKHVAEHPDDFHTMRVLSIAQLAAKKPRDAAATLLAAYTADPLMAKERMDLQELGLEEARAGSLADFAQSNASKNGAGGWLLAAVMRQGLDQEARAAKCLKEARAAGLPSEVGMAFVGVLSKE